MLQLDACARGDRDLLDVATGQVQRDVAEAVDVEHRCDGGALGQLRHRDVEGDEGFGIERRAELRKRNAACEVRGGGGEQVARVERPGDRAQRVLGVRELVRGDDPRAARSREEQPVVGPDVDAVAGVLERERPARPADARIDDRQMHADRHVADRVREDQRPLENRLRRNAVRDVDDLDLGRDAFHHPVARADEVVLQPEVGEKRDEHALSLTRLLGRAMIGR